jgi:thiol-disulfide isomerase/thioredoxin
MFRRSTLAIALAGIVATLWFGLPAMGANDERPSQVPEGFVLFDQPRPVPETAFVDSRGRSTTLGDFKGRVVLLNFWATWCGPCIREMPSLERLQAALGGEDFTVLALSEDFQGWDVISAFVARHGLATLPVFRDIDMKASKAFRIPGLPTSILIDRQGRQVGRLRGTTEWDSEQSLRLIRHFMAQGKS